MSVNRILGQILSQFCIFPELNRVYSELFSNQGGEFFAVPKAALPDELANKGENDIIEYYLKRNTRVIPLSILSTSKNGDQFYYMAEEEAALVQPDSSAKLTGVKVDINENYWLRQRNIIILGHNSKIREIMFGFESFRGEWNYKDEREIINIMVIDDSKSLDRLDHYRDYSYVNEVVEAEYYETDKIKMAINRFIDANEEDTSILILSDDQVQEKDVDSYALTNLIYVQDIIFERIKADPDYDTDRIDIIVEILNPKNYDVVHNYNIDNIVISNRYISKMVTQIGEKIELYEFYKDILTYDTDQTVFDSKEVYAKSAKCFLNKLPGPCTAAELIRGIYEASPKDNKSLLMGIAHPHGETELFKGNQMNRTIILTEKDKLIMYSNH